MLSKILTGCYRANLHGSVGTMLQRRPQTLRLPLVPKRVYSDLIPPSQYDMPWPKKFNLVHAMTHYYELIPMFACTALAVLGVIFNAIWACFNKVDIVFYPHNAENRISRTMNLRCPTIHKLITINQEYPPWPQMQDALDKVDVVFLSRNQGNISRTMDLRNPTCHKLITINQRYDPWPEMQDSRDAMKAGERRYKLRMKQKRCPLPEP